MKKIHFLCLSTEYRNRNKTNVLYSIKSERNALKNGTLVRLVQYKIQFYFYVYK